MRRMSTKPEIFNITVNDSNGDVVYSFKASSVIMGYEDEKSNPYFIINQASKDEINKGKQ